MADKFLPDESEIVQIFKDKSPIPSNLNSEQKKSFHSVIKG